MLLLLYEPVLHTILTGNNEPSVHEEVCAKRVCVRVRVLKAPLCVPWAVLTLPPCVVVVCVLNTCSPYPCHSGHRITLHRRVPGLAQLAAQEHQEHELRQPRLPQNHGGWRRRNPHRTTQRVHRSRVSSSEWQPQSALHCPSSRGRHHRQQLSLVLRGTDALQRQMKKLQRKGVWNITDMEVCAGVWKSPFLVHVGLERKNRLAHTHILSNHSVIHTHKLFTGTLLSRLFHLHDHNHIVHSLYQHHFLVTDLRFICTLCLFFWLLKCCFLLLGDVCSI